MTNNKNIAIGHWQSLQSYLALDESSGNNILTVRNTSLKSVLYPSVEFTDIKVEFEGSMTQNPVTHARLRAGESFEIVLVEPLGMSSAPKVTAKIDIDEFSKISIVSEQSIHQAQTDLNEWLKKFDKFDVFGRLGMLISSIPKVSDATTIAEIKTLESLPDAVQVIFGEFEDTVGKHATVDQKMSPYESVRSTAKSVGGQLRRISNAAKKNDIDAIPTHLEELLDLPDPSIEFETRRNTLLVSLRNPS